MESEIQMCSKSRKRNLECGQGISQSLEQQSLCGTTCSGFCLCEFTFQVKVLDVERLCLLSKATQMKNEEAGFQSRECVLNFVS